MKALYKASATTTGGRAGHVKSDDGLIDMKLELPKELGGKGGAHTNPEQLFAAGYSACFGSALQFVAKENKVDIGDNFDVTATVGIGKHPELGGFLLEVVLDVTLPGIDEETGEKLINEAHEVCPYSRATQDNIDVTLNLMV
ncbi:MULTISPECIES: organic hydroperoxide resistance protein [Galbibacter]|uniref:Organic hydroperoxide resistance protein n=1 Tax=Galbibacter pacificus TaxID=2996052 RepID=A0ABT6FUY9_9FLAO|nr:organic hydroperoxide resistance protein [Galbibacter pacificus]MDG3583625.1 organic hydroperoxide resistance protein [Galbibacter pacificus]MDG3586899.1 organic hydroperoxide resistance protein [Galbibacter pacificus]